MNLQYIKELAYLKHVFAPKQVKEIQIKSPDQEFYWKIPWYCYIEFRVGSLIVTTSETGCIKDRQMSYLARDTPFSAL